MRAAARMEMRISFEDKQLLNQAAALTGHNATSFVLETALKEAKRVWEAAHSVLLSAQDFDTLLKQMDTPTQPNPALWQALQRTQAGQQAGQQVVRFHSLLEAHTYEFGSGDLQVDRFLQRQASSQEQADVSRVYVLADANNHIRAFYTLRAAEVQRVGGAVGLSLPRYPLPALRLGLMAVDAGWQRQGMGAWLIADAIRRCAEAAEALGVYVLIADAERASAQTWFRRFGFLPFPDNPTQLYLPLIALD
jgi:uncharacterized protein (DUF1778 family)/predicted N-acetyltransferase YhbS